MEARIGHVTDARDARPAWGITYRRYSDVRASHVRVQADDLDSALSALAEYIGNNQYAVTAIYPEQQSNAPRGNQRPAATGETEQDNQRASNRGENPTTNAPAGLSALRNRLAAALADEAQKSGRKDSFANRYGVDDETDGHVDAVRIVALLWAADRLHEMRMAEREWLPATGLHKGEQEIRRLAA
ncbi:hypothetical protein [Streptomyces ambofaciens]